MFMINKKDEPLKTEEEMSVDDQSPEEENTSASAEEKNDKQSEAADNTATDPENQEEETPEQQLANVKELLLRKAAEFENYKKRTETEMGNVIRLANQTLVLSVLPILDDLERSVKAGKNVDDAASIQKGIELIASKLQKVLEGQGVKPLETVGKNFDVHFHDAMMQVPRADIPPHTIIEEVERGYSMNGKVIRHAKVIVSTSEGAEPTEDSSSDPKDESA
jgi:molecular chaperone GrpE